MAKYCCFFCPDNNFSERSLGDRCENCGRPFGFPLFNPPQHIGQYKVLEALNRGFYAATYVVERTGPLASRVVLKVSPKEFYSFFNNKDFERECQTHLSVSADTDHIVAIRDMGHSSVSFGSDELECYFAELEYVEGPILSDYLEGREKASAQIVAQISIDLLRLHEEFRKKGVYHNDLHPANIIVKHLAPTQHRANAIDGSIRVIAIDLGSVLEYSRSDSQQMRYGDLHWICDHLNKLTNRLLTTPDESSDLEYRLASALQVVFHMLAAEVQNQRTPSSDDLIDRISEAYWRLPRHPWRPWSQPWSLQTFGASYNAQTLQPWHVPLLLVDQGQEWLNQITIPGPQVIVGMRGCGKTIFLRALQFHARAAKNRPEESDDVAVKRIQQDSFVGLFVSAQRLLDTPARQATRHPDPFTRLFAAYALEAVRALLHLSDIARAEVADSAHLTMASAIQEFMSQDAKVTNVLDLQELDRRLDKLLVEISRGDGEQSLIGHPSEAFAFLAETLRRCALCWSDVQVLYLLDDVSTRYLKEPGIRELLSTLIFQNPICAFKMTSEIQTMELGLTTPGENLLARVGRDLSVFDLGSEVYKRIKSRRGTEFVQQILSKRADQFPGHLRVTPSNILGDCALETIAQEIASSTETSRKRKEVYRGISALAHVCVGDIGDVISLYERILRRQTSIIPVPDGIQSECFQEHCSHRLYDLNRRGSHLKDAAKSFAEASYELLVRSYREANTKDQTKPRLRQYASIYVRVTTGDKGRQIERLRDLIDAGVFVFAGGSPRSKTRDSDPILQFKLTFRRIYGLVNFIGLSERDRFELSGPELEEWLDNPGNGKEVLLRNLGGGLGPIDTGDEEIDLGSGVDIGAGGRPEATPQWPTLFDALEDSDSTGQDGTETIVGTDDVRVEQLSDEEVSKIGFGSATIGLGFEERTLHSVMQISQAHLPNIVYTVQYGERGKSDEILQVLLRRECEVRSVEYSNLSEDVFSGVEGPALIDVTGLAKPAIFYAIRASLKRDAVVYVMHTGADVYYPRNEDLLRLVAAQERRDRHEFFEVMADILTGEERPYSLLPLLDSDVDQTRRRVLYAFSAPKHERLLSLLDQREFDRLELVAPTGDTERNRVAREVAGIAATDNPDAHIELMGSDDLTMTVELLLERFVRCYTHLGLNFEIGLTGSKMQTVAAAAVSAVRKVSQCWYVSPNKFDVERFTRGSGQTRFFKVLTKR